jgi:hypothetical protein
MRNVIVEHAKRYPLWELDDLYKLVHQAALGSEHAVTDERAARDWLARELAGMGPGPDEALVEPISPNGAIVRVHLRTCARLGLAPERLLQAFLRTAREFRGSVEAIERSLTEAEHLARDGLLPFERDAVTRFAARMALARFPAIHHSTAYEAVYCPAYRVVAAEFLSPEFLME